MKYTKAIKQMLKSLIVTCVFAALAWIVLCFILKKDVLFTPAVVGFSCAQIYILYVQLTPAKKH